MTRGVFAAAAATGILSLYGTPAVADSFGAGVADEPSNVLTENKAKAPVTAPVNVCNNAFGVFAAFNETYGNSCGNTSHQAEDRSSGAAHGDSADHYGENAGGSAEDSYGVLNGNEIHAPVHLPVNACGNSVELISLFNDAYGNTCVNDGGYGDDGGYGKEEDEPGKETPPPPTKVKAPPTYEAEKPPAEEEVPGNPPHLAETGSDGLIAASAAGAVLITGGAMLYRRGRLASRR